MLAGHDQPTLRYLERRRLAHALPLHDQRTGARLVSRAWQITAAGVAAHLGLARAAPRRRRTWPESRQIDLEEAIASASSGDAPVCAALTEPDAPADPSAGVSAPQGRSSNPALAAAKPETASL